MEETSTTSLGFWTCWSLTVGIMIGSGIFILPSVLAPYGMMSFAGWGITAIGSIAIALVISRLSARTSRSGGVYIYTQEAFGDLMGFMIAWGYWIAYWLSIPAIAIAFVGYMGVFVPELNNNPKPQAVCALALIWVLTLINMRSLKGAGFTQLLMTGLKLIPLCLIIAFGFATGDTTNLPAVNPQNDPFWATLATTALLTMWAFSGLEAGAVAASDVKDPERTIPKAILFGTLVVAFIYIASTFAVMLLVPAEILVGSSSPFSEAAKGLGVWGPYLIAIGAMIATAGSLNGIIFVTGQMPMALAIEGAAPKIFARKSQKNAPYVSLILGSSLASVLLLLNYSKGLIGMFTYLAMMATFAVLVPLLVCAAAELKYSFKSAKGWTAIAILAAVYSLFAIIGSGWNVLMWGGILMLGGLPVYGVISRKA